jgi:hypothetical protein
MAKAKNVADTSVALAVIPPLVITPEKTLPVDGNFAAILGYLRLRGKEVAKMKLTEANVDKAKLIKKEASAYRKGVEEKLKTTIELLFDGPKAVLKSKAQDLFDAIDQIEQAATSVLDKIEDSRVADLNKAYEAYKEAFQKEYQLDSDSIALIELRKWYYNKTPVGNEKKAKEDLEQQFKDLKKRQDERAADVKMIQTLCKDDPRLSERLYVEMLERASASVVAEKIAEEKQRLAALDAPFPDGPDEEPEDAPEEEAAAAKENIVDIASKLDFQSDFPNRMAEKAFLMRYPCDCGDQITTLFELLKKFNVTTKALKSGETYVAQEGAA